MFAIFVDAGFLMAAGATQCSGSPARDSVRCDYPKVVQGLLQAANNHAADNYLRTYWYDASASGIPDEDQTIIAELTGVKIRLGRLVRGEQKGVDSRIIIDMMKLALNHTVDTFFLLTGDEDLAEAVEEVQNQGARVILMSIEGYIQSRLLVQAADERLVLEGLVESCFTAVKMAERQPNDDAFDAGVSFGATWILTADAEALDKLRLQRNRDVPREIDTQLLRAADAQLGGKLKGNDPLRHAVRAGFWSIIEQ